VFYIVEEKCTECVGFYGRPQCAEVCPSDCCVQGTEETDLLTKKNNLQKE
jgi:ferredoxin